MAEMLGSCPASGRDVFAVRSVKVRAPGGRCCLGNSSVTSMERWDLRGEQAAALKEHQRGLTHRSLQREESINSRIGKWPRQTSRTSPALGC